MLMEKWTRYGDPAKTTKPGNPKRLCEILQSGPRSDAGSSGNKGVGVF